MAESTAGVALITGAGRGIGRAIAERLADDGQDIIVADIAGAQDNIDAVVAAVEQRGRRAVGVTGDVSNPEDVQRMIAEGTGALGGPDGVRGQRWHCAGGRDFGCETRSAGSHA
ncbi:MULTISPECIES: SDR family NAD(P)-dependent oxidoreductase [unclassified Arthrobacter]|uniref:SDR family NAD(P)-dependent oxidoreductase n=1 Tax=unclassified Arthrobacter TaxID=235627 RepID=UPI00215768DB|nr:MULTISPECIES: SDR family NAD(P)-dependent oxidoreductase [unclassified Arthrobacter]